MVSELVSCLRQASIFRCARSKKLSGGAGLMSEGGGAGIRGGWTGVEPGDVVAQLANDTISGSNANRQVSAFLFGFICNPFGVELQALFAGPRSGLSGLQLLGVVAFQAIELRVPAPALDLPGTGCSNGRADQRSGNVRVDHVTLPCTA